MRTMPVDNMLFNYAMRGKLLDVERALWYPFADPGFQESTFEENPVVYYS